MRCLNCHQEEIPSTAEYCPQCKIHFPSLLRDVLAQATLLRNQTYRLDYALGRGSFGITYQAHHTALNEVFAIKEFYPIEFAMRNQVNQSVIIPDNSEHSYRRGLQRFMGEGRILAKLNHPYVVRVHDMFEDNDTAYMVMDLVKGRTLRYILKKQQGNRFSLPKVESILGQIVEALTAIHQSGIYHLDLKPENVILTPENKICLIDFGAARQVIDSRRMETRLFTENYAAPEIITGGELGPESDLFELGMMLHQLLTGKLPPPAMKRLNEQKDWHPEGLIAPWDRLVTSALQLNRSDRPATVHEWWEAGFQSLHERNGNGHYIVAPTIETLRGQFPLSDLLQEGMQRRFGRGVIRKVLTLTQDLAVVIAAGGATLFQLSTAKALWEVDCPVDCGTLSPDHKLLILVFQQWVYIWDMVTGRLVQQFQGHEQPICQVVCSHQEQLFFCGHKSETVTAWDARSGEAFKQFFKPMGAIAQLAVSGSGKYLATGSLDGNVYLWDVEKGREICSLQGHEQSIESLAFSPNEQLLASGSRDNTIQLWSIPTTQPLKRLKGHLDWVKNLMFSQDNRLLASSSGIQDKSIRLWHLTEGQEIQRFQGHENTIISLDFCPQNRYLVSGSYDQTLKVWDVVQGKECRSLKQHHNWVYGVACSPNGTRIATANNDRMIHLWKVKDGSEVGLLEGHRDAVTSVAFSPDNQYLLSGGWDHTVRLWDISLGMVVRTFSEHTDWISAVAISSNCKYLASASLDKTVRIWDVSSGWLALLGNKSLRILKGHLDQVTSLAFSPDSRLLVSGSKDQTLRLWEVDSGQEVHNFIGHHHNVKCVAFSPDGEFLASGSWDESVRIWHIASQKHIKPSFIHSSYVNALAFTPDGQFLAAGGRDGLIFVWDVLSGKEIKKLHGHTNRINSLTFHPQSGELISADQDGVVRLWRI